MDEDISLKHQEIASTRLSPSRLVQASICPHFAYLEKFGNSKLKIPESAGNKRRKEQGKVWESQLVSTIPGIAEPEWDMKNLSAGFKATLSLMTQGVPHIHGAVLMGSALAGIADVLKKVPGHSNLGDYAYLPIEIKSHKEASLTDMLQATAYSVLLEKVIGTFPKQAGIWLNTGKTFYFDPSEKIDYFNQTRDQLQDILDNKVPTEPIWCRICVNCSWLKYCNQARKDMDHLSLLPSGGKGTVTKLYDAGIKTVHQLARMKWDDLKGKTAISDSSLEKLWLHAKTRVAGKPLMIKKPEFPTGKPIIFYDIETLEDCVILHGMIVLDKDGAKTSKFFLAESPSDEKQAWYEFLDFMASYKDCVVYTWTTFENDYVEKCWKQYGGNKEGYSNLKGGLTDQLIWVKESFAFPVRSYSIKEVAPVFGFHWAAEDAGGLNCEAWYEEWLESHDESLKQKILDYNKDDVVAMVVIYEGLQKLSHE